MLQIQHNSVNKLADSYNLVTRVPSTYSSLFSLEIKPFMWPAVAGPVDSGGGGGGGGRRV